MACLIFEIEGWLCESFSEKPTKGIGPLTSSLPKKCSTTELRGQGFLPAAMLL